MARIPIARDRERRPFIDKGQITRTVAFCLVLAALFVLAPYRQGHAALQLAPADAATPSPLAFAK